jgi:DNA (cytosine-5)-methyltransferase 1
VVGYCERETYTANLLVDRMEAQALEPAPVFAGDLADIDWASLAGAVDGFVGGIPCQPFSVAGGLQGTEDERWIWGDLWGAIRRTGAWFLAIENVAAFTLRGLDPLLCDLAEAGWDAEWGCIRASDVGAPHRRNRFFLLAVAHSQRERLEGLMQAGTAAGSTGRGGGTTVGLFPPGPDRDWSAVPPEAQPAFRRMADGVAHPLDQSRSDRLRACGNGVVALQAAYAFAELVERLKR